MTGGPTVVILCAIAFWLWCLYDFSRTPQGEVRTFDRPVWILLLVFTNVLGGLLWVTLGRPEGRPPD